MMKKYVKCSGGEYMAQIDRKSLLDEWIKLFDNHYSVKRLLNANTRLDENFLETFYMQTIDQYGEQLSLNDEEKADVWRKIKSMYSIYQEDGGALVGEYEHDFDWYNNLLADESYEEYYWPRYKQYLSGKHFSETVIRKLEEKTLPDIMSYIGNPNEDSAYSIRGLVVGDVQSGKTSNYLGLITKAADAGYKVIFLLTGTIESLRQQTQIRVEEGFIGYDSVNATDVGVGRGSRTPKAFTSREKDFKGADDQNTTYRINDNISEPMIFVIKKNVSVLRKVYASIKNINTTRANEKISTPMLLIDDEADNASINTNKPDVDPTKINNYIRKILALFARNTYIGFTATPFANVFISYNSEAEMLENDLFPKNFIYALEAPSNYCGARKYFFEANDNLRFITDYDEMLFPMSHKKDWEGTRLFDSLYEAINAFLIINAVRDCRDIDKRTHRSMLVNMSRFTKVQFVISDIVENYLNTVRRTVRQTYKLSFDEYIQNPVIHSLYKTFTSLFENNNKYGKHITWEEMFSQLYESIKDVTIAVVNSSKNSTKLKYSENAKNGLRVIAVGGLALSRGLTLEGLCVSYFYRNTATFDVLMQMGRWFGYRDDYDDLCRIYMPRTSFEYYREISESIDNLKSDIKKMGESGKRPEDYGIRVRNNSADLGITAANKMRNTKHKIDRKSFYGNVFETPYLSRNLQLIEANIEKTKGFLLSLPVSRIDNDEKYPYFRDIETEQVIALLKSLDIHEANENFDKKQILKFLNTDTSLDKFDVLIMGGDTDNFVDCGNDISVPCVKRRYDIVNRGDYIDQEIIRINAQRAHLWGRKDTAHGLSKPEIAEIESRINANAQDYMTRGRNPLLIIYFIEPNNGDENTEEDFSSENGKTRDIRNARNLIKELTVRKYNYLIGYAIGFPSKDGKFNIATSYVVNKSCNYYDKQHEEDYEMYGEEI